MLVRLLITERIVLSNTGKPKHLSGGSPLSQISTDTCVCTCAITYIVQHILCRYAMYFSATGLQDRHPGLASKRGKLQRGMVKSGRRPDPTDWLAIRGANGAGRIFASKGQYIHMYYYIVHSPRHSSSTLVFGPRQPRINNAID